MVTFFILSGVSRANPSIYLAILFYHPGKKKLGKICPIFLPRWLKNG